MRAVEAVRDFPGVTRASFETLLASLASASCGLDQRELLELFDKTCREFFGASSVCCCCCHQPDQSNDWRVVEFAGDPVWGLPGDTVSDAGQESILRAERIRHAVLGQSPQRHRASTESRPEPVEVAVPLSGAGGEVAGVGLLSWEGADGICEELLERLTLVGVSFGGLLEHARLFEQVHSSRDRWVRVIDAIPDSIVVHDTHGRIVRINRPLAARLAVHPSRLVGRPIREVLGRGRLGEPNMPACPLCAGEASGMIEVQDEGAFLVSTTSLFPEDAAGAHTIHVLVNIREKMEAERRYRDLFDSIQEGAFFCDPDGRLVDANDALIRLLGCSSREDLLTKNLFEDLLPPAGRDRLLTELRNSDILRNRETELRRGDNRPLEVLLHASAVRDASGNLIQYRGLILDITDQKNSRAELRRERDFNWSILNHTQNIILVLDASGRIGYVNHRAAEIGYSADALHGLPLERLVHTSHRPIFREALRSVLETGAVRGLEIPFLRREGSITQFAVHLSSMREKSGDLDSVVVVMTDITETSQLQAKLAHAEKMAALGQLVSGVAHEVNNPLSGIVGFTDLLLEHPELPEFARENLGIILEEAERTRLIVQNLLRFAREMPPQREVVEVNAVLRRTIELRSYGLANRKIEILERLSENPPVVVADPHQLEQVFLNILNNAFDAMEQGAEPGRIEVETVAGAEQVEIRFRDNGPGIAHPDRIFEPFFTTKPVGKGTGLGLSICYGIIHAHNGEIVCENNTDRAGCTFIVRLPAARFGSQMEKANA